MNFYNFYLNESKQKFIIPKNIKSNYKIIGDLSNIKNWKSKIILGNNLNSDENKNVGDWDNVGYIMIDNNSNNIIPIARSDEHQLGYELIEYLKHKKLIKGLYTPIFALSQDYIYSNDKNNIQHKLNVYKKFLEYGGNNLKIQDSNSNYIGTIEDFIERQGNVEIKKGEISVYGRQIVDKLESIAMLLSKVLKSPNESLIHKLNEKALSFLETHRFDLIVELNVDDKFIDKLNIDISKDFDNYDVVEKGFFGMNGIKNIIHKNIKYAIRKPEKWKSESIIKIFGDVKKANNEFNRLGNI